MNRPFFVIVSFVVSTLAALAVSGSLHAQALSVPLHAPLKMPTCTAAYAIAPGQACDANDASNDD